MANLDKLDKFLEEEEEKPSSGCSFLITGIIIGGAGGLICAIFGECDFWSILWGMLIGAVFTGVIWMKAPNTLNHNPDLVALVVGGVAIFLFMPDIVNVNTASRLIYSIIGAAVAFGLFRIFRFIQSL